MPDHITLYSFGNYDRSGKVRWLANELNIDITEERISLGDHRKPAYRQLNPYAAIPAVQWQEKTLVESAAICTLLAEAYPDHRLIVTADEAERADYLQWMAITGDTLENRLVEYTLSTNGILPPEFKEMHERTLQFKLKVTLDQMPETGFLVAERFTLADINLAYSLRLAVGSGLLSFTAVEDYLTPLIERPAAKAAGFFDSLKRQ